MADSKRTNRSKSSDAPSAEVGFGETNDVRFEIGDGMRVLSVSTIQVSIGSVEGPNTLEPSGGARRTADGIEPGFAERIREGGSRSAAPSPNPRTDVSSSPGSGIVWSASVTLRE